MMDCSCSCRKRFHIRLAWVISQHNEPFIIIMMGGKTSFTSLPLFTQKVSPLINPASAWVSREKFGAIFVEYIV
jgi:hypothetical protein